MRKKIVIGFLVFCTTSVMFAQQVTYLDSVNKQLMVPMPDTTKINLLNKIAEELLYIDQDKIIEYAQLALELSEEIGYQNGMAHAYNNLGIYYREIGVYSKSIDYFFNALKIMEKENNQKGIARSYNLIGILYYYLDNFDLSLDYYLKALKLNQEQHDRKWIAGNSNNIGMIYERTGQYELALNYYMKSLEMDISLGNKNWISNNYGNIGSLYLKMGNPLSLEYFLRRLDISKEQGNQVGEAKSDHLIGSYYIQNGEFKNAVGYLLQGYKLAYANKSLNTLAVISEKLSAVYDSLRLYDSAFMYQKIFKTYNDSLNLSDNTQKITRLRMQYQYNKKSQSSRLTYENSKFKQSLSAIGLIFILVVLLMIYGRKRSRVKQQKLKQYQLELENMTLNEELRFKEKTLQDNVIYLLDKNEIIASVLEEIKEVKKICQKENIRIIDEIIAELKVGTQDDTWNEFELRFNQIHSDFYSRLNRQFPQLTANEKKLCAFLKLKMSTKEIASMTQQSINSIETARSRLRKKLNLTNPSQSLTEFLKQI